MKENPYLLTLVKYILPEEIFEYFEITRIEEQSKELHIYLDENPDKPDCKQSSSFATNTFNPADFQK